MLDEPETSNPTTHPLLVVRAQGDPVELAGELVATPPAGAPVDLRATTGPILPSDIEAAARHALAERAGEPAGAHPHRDLLLERAQWCDDHFATAEALARSIADRDAEVQEAASRAAQYEARLASVGEQQAAAEAVLEQAHKQLLELDVAGKPENEVRRDLEQANHAARQANAASEQARDRATQLAETLLEVEERRHTIESERASLEGISKADTAPVAAALARAEQAPLVPPDPATLALADELELRQSILADFGEPGPAVSPQELAAAEATVVTARETVAELRQPPSNEPPPWWGRLTELHNVVVDAEMAASGHLSRPSARKKLEEALAAERALLDEVGFDSHLDAMVSGGQRSGRRFDPEALPAAEEALARGEDRLAGLRAVEAANAVHRRARADVLRVRALAGALLGVGTSAVTPELLRRDRPDPVATAELTAALAAAAAEAGATLFERARAWLAASATVVNRLDQLAIERDDILERYRSLAPETEAAAAEAESRAAAAKAGRRQVEVLEAELANRVRPAVDPTTRAATAAALRDRIEALEGRIVNARVDAEAAHLDAMSTLADVSALADQAKVALEDLARSGAAAIALLPADHGHAGDLLTDLGALASALRTEAGEPSSEDFATAVRTLLDPDRRTSDVIVDPTEPVPASGTEAVLDALVAAATQRPVVVVASHPALLTWADELPPGLGTVVPPEGLHLGARDADEPSDPLTDSDHAPAHSPPPAR